MLSDAVSAALRLGDRLLVEHCDTGDIVTTLAVEHTVEVLAEALAAAVLADVDGPSGVRHIQLPTAPGEPEPPKRADQVSCHALALRLRELARDVAALDDSATQAALAPLVPVVTRFAHAMDEHAVGLARLAQAWTPGAPPTRAVRARRESIRLHRILLGECHAVVTAVE